MKFFIVALIVLSLVFFVAFIAVFIRKTKLKQSEDLDIVTWLHVAFGELTEEEKKKYEKYKAKKDEEDKEQKDFVEKIENAKKENQNLEQIMLIFDELTKKYPYYGYFIKKADLYIENRNYDKALCEYKKAISSINAREFYQYKSYTYHLISQMYLNIEDYLNAIKYASKAISVHKGGDVDVDFVEDFTFDPLMYSKDMAFEDRAEIYFKIKKYDLALKDVKKAIAECALNSRLIFHIKILIELKRYDEAEKLCIKYFQKDKTNFANYNACKGYIAQAQNDFKEAFEFYTKALSEKKDELCFYETDIIRKNRVECYKVIKSNV